MSRKSTEFHEMSARRAGQLADRLGLAVCISLAAYLLMPGVWPIFWLVCVFVSQILEHYLIDKDLVVNRPKISPLRRAVIVGATYCNTSIYVSLSVYIWFGGPAGQMFSTMLMAGTLLHVCLHLYEVRSIQIASAAPPTVLLFGLPIFGFVIQHGFSLIPIAVMVLSATLYFCHMIMGVAQNYRMTRSLRAATAYAEEQRALAVEQSQSKSNFLATISHEIRTPLNAITSAANLMRDTPLSERQAEYVSILMTGSEVLLGLINQVLDMSKIEAGKMELDLSDVSLGDLAAQITRLWQGPAQAHGLDFSVSLDPTLPDPIRADKVRLSQVLFNLVSNAVKFTEQGRIDIRITAAPDPTTGAARVMFEVRDTGPGVAPDAVERVFHSFEQAHAGTTRRFGGTGLGLAISRSLAKMMLGEITLESTLGEGSTFRLFIPLTPSPPTTKAAAPGAPESATTGGVETHASVEGPALSILIAEDHEVNRKVLGYMLEALQPILTVVGTGAEAVEAASLQAFDIILMYHQMPVMSGLDATRIIRATPGPNRTAPIIALTANAFDEQKRQWLAAGADAFLAKPVDPAALFGAITQLVAEDRRDLDTSKPHEEVEARPAFL